MQRTIVLSVTLALVIACTGLAQAPKRTQQRKQLRPQDRSRQPAEPPTQRDVKDALGIRCDVYARANVLGEGDRISTIDFVKKAFGMSE